MVFWLILLSVRVFAAPPAPESVHIDIAGAYNNAANQEFHRLIERKQLDFQHSIQLIDTIPKRYQGKLPHSALIILGDDMLSSLEQWPAGYDAIIAVHVSPAVFAEKYRSIDQQHQKHITALFSGSPTARQLRLAQLILPRTTQWVLPYHASQQMLLDALLASTPDSLHLNAYAWTSAPETLKNLQPLLRETNAVLALEALGAITPESIRGMLLSAYRQGKPVIGMDAAYVRAGVLAATDTSIDQYTLETEQLIRDWFSDKSLPAPAHPKSFSVHINQRVAQSLNLILPDEQALTYQLLQQEETP